MNRGCRSDSPTTKMNYTTIVQQVPVIDLYHCTKCNFWSIDKDCQCQPKKEKKVAKKEADKADKKSNKS